MEMTVKECSKCKELLPLNGEYFKKDSRSVSGFRCSCKLCNYYDDIKYKYGLNRKQYTDLYNEQSGRCALCSRDLYLSARGIKTNIHIDHDHRTGKIRGMLCMNCNVNLGWYLNKKDKVNEYAGKE